MENIDALKSLEMQKAMIAILTACMKADGSYSDVERDAFVRAVGFNKLFDNDLIISYMKELLLLLPSIGSKGLIDKFKSDIPEQEKDFLYAMAIDILMFDGRFSDNDKDIILHLRDALQLNAELAEKIMDVMQIKNRNNFLMAQ